MFASACSTVCGARPPRGVAYLKSVRQWDLEATQLATMLARELKVARVDVKPPFGVLFRTLASAPVRTLAILAAIRTALSMPCLLPVILRPWTNWAKEVAVATVVRSLTTTRRPRDERRMALASIERRFCASTYSTELPRRRSAALNR